MEGHNIKVFATYTQINNSARPPITLARRLVEHIHWDKMVLFPVMNSVTHNTGLTHRLDSYKFIPEVNSRLPDIDATYWPKKKPAAAVSTYTI